MQSNSKYPVCAAADESRAVNTDGRVMTDTGDKYKYIRVAASTGDKNTGADDK